MEKARNKYPVSYCVLYCSPVYFTVVLYTVQYQTEFSDIALIFVCGYWPVSEQFH